MACPGIVTKKQGSVLQMIIDLNSPLLLVLDITNNCNLSCKYCFQAFRKPVRHTQLSYQRICEILAESHDLKIFDINLCGGEPFIHKDVIPIITKVKAYGFGISIVTNATLIDDELASKLNELDVIKNIQVSFDGHNAVINNSSRDDFANAFSGFLSLIKYAKNKDESPSVGIVIGCGSFATT